jgi:hypothetical protein
MSLYRHHVGQQALDLLRIPADLDVTASRTGNKIFLHVVNTQRTRSVPAQVTVAGMTIRSGSVFEIAVEPDFEVWAETRDVIAPRRKDFRLNEKRARDFRKGKRLGKYDRLARIFHNPTRNSTKKLCGSPDFTEPFTLAAVCSAGDRVLGV